MIRFGEFSWDAETSTLLRAGVAVTLQPKLYDLLALLLSAPGRLWTREELDARVWPDVTVTEDSLSQAIRRLRVALGDDRREPRFIETVPRRGYRWIGPVVDDRGARPQSRPTLARPIDPFLGRRAEQERLRGLLSRARLVTITGPGGIGKTRLALELPEVLVHCRLGSVTDERGLRLAMATGLGLPIESAGPGAILAALEGCEGWVLLDEAEGAAELVANAVAGWLAASSTVRLLVTSRVRLQLAAEHCLELGPLAEEDGVALYRARSQAIEPLADDPVSDIRALVAALEGFPLAIELAAARRSLLSPAAMRQRLERSLSVLASTSLDRPQRHRSMSEVLAWSWSLLSPTEQRAAVRLSAFVGGIPLSAAEHALEDLGDPLLLEALRHRSWLVQEGERLGQYTMLKTVELAAERENLWAAFHATSDPERAEILCRGLLWIDGSARRDDRRLVDAVNRLLQLTEERPLLQARALVFRSHLLQALDPTAALADAQQAVQLAGSDPVVRSIALVALASKLPVGHPDTLALLEQAVELGREASDVGCEAEALSLLGYVLMQRGRWSDALGCHRAAVERWGSLGARWSQARLLVHYARSALFCWDLQGAHRSALSALEILDPVHDPWLYGRGLVVLAHLAHWEGRLDDASGLIDQVDTLGSAVWRFDPNEPLRIRVTLLIERGQIEQARLLLASGPDPASLSPLARAELGGISWRLLLAEGRWEEAARELHQCAETFRELGVRVGEANGYAWSALVAAALGDEPAVARWSDRARGLVEPQMGPMGPWLLKIVDAAALLLAMRSGSEEARERLQAKLDEMLRYAPTGPTAGLPCPDPDARTLVHLVSPLLSP